MLSDRTRVPANGFHRKNEWMSPRSGRPALIAGVVAAAAVCAAGQFGHQLLGAVAPTDLAWLALHRWLPATAQAQLSDRTGEALGPALSGLSLLALLVLAMLAGPRIARPWLPARRPKIGLLRPLPAFNGASWLETGGIAVGAGALLLAFQAAATGQPLGLASVTWAGLLGGLFSGVFHLLLGGLEPRPVAAEERRRFLAGAGALALATLLGLAGIRWLRDAVDTEAHMAAAPPPPPAEPPPDFTPIERFYIVSKNIGPDPEVDIDSWRLVVNGRERLSLDLRELLSLANTTVFATLECINNPVGGNLIGNARWEGVPLAELMQRARIPGATRRLVFRGFDRYSETLPLQAALRPEVMVAVRMNGSLLSREHGFPARLLVPGRYGLKSVKWLTEVSFRSEPWLGYWAKRGWNPDAGVRTMSRIDIPAPGYRGDEDTIRVAGIAFAGSRGISAVEVQLDGGDWRAAALGTDLGPHSWRTWDYRWTPLSRGHHTIRVRAVDGQGLVQVENPRPARPEGATGYHTVSVDLT